MKIPIQGEDDAKFQMAPMIDMVFLLLVFFMCASHMSTVQSVELEIPTATKAVVPKERPNRFVVNITKDGLIHAANRKGLSVDELKTLVREYKDADAALKVYLRADQETPHVYVRKVMNVMGEAGIDDFIFGAFLPSN